MYEWAEQVLKYVSVMHRKGLAKPGVHHVQIYKRQQDNNDITHEIKTLETNKYLVLLCISTMKISYFTLTSGHDRRLAQSPKRRSYRFL